MIVGEVGINYVMIRIPRTYSEMRSHVYEHKSGLLIKYIEGTNESAGHNVQSGTVMGVGNLQYLKEDPDRMKWETTNELLPGDEVVFYYNVDCWNTGEFLVDGEDVYFFIRYHNVYFAIREGKIIPVNGYNLIEPIKETPNGTLWTPTKDSKKYGYVRHVGQPVKEHSMTDYSDEVPRFNGTEHVGYGLREGDFVILEKWSAKPIMYSIQNFVGNYYTAQRLGIVAVIEDISQIKI